MRELRPWVRLPCFAMAAAVAACVAPEDSISRSTDERAARPAASQPSLVRIEASDGSLAALTAEVRQLRIAVEQLARSQAETQALGAALSAQQGRLLQITQQLDAARKDVDSATARSRELEEQVQNVSNDVSHSTGAQRDDLEGMLRAIQAEQNRVELDLQQVRARESELSRSFALEENRWKDLLSRMERLTQ
jgi:predicted  nucleic acid-binding Zn-ribbon protein